MPARRCCQKCPSGNTLLEYSGTRETVVQDQERTHTGAVLWFVPTGQPQRLYLHRFTCAECGYSRELHALSGDPDDAILQPSEPDDPGRSTGSVLGL